MSTTWILIAHRGGAKIIEHKTPELTLKLTAEIDHAEGRLQEREINSDKPGRSFSSFDSQKHSVSNEESGKEHIKKQFARSLIERLEKHAHLKDFEHLILVAEPHLLGLLREQLTPTLKKTLKDSLDKDLAHTTMQELPDHLRGLVRL